MRLGKSPGPLLRVRVNISAQWLIGIFVRVLHSKSGLINCAGWEDELFLSWSSSFPLPLSQSPTISQIVGRVLKSKLKDYNEAGQKSNTLRKSKLSVVNLP